MESISESTIAGIENLELYYTSPTISYRKLDPQLVRRLEVVKAIEISKNLRTQNYRSTPQVYSQKIHCGEDPGESTKDWKSATASSMEP